MDEVRLPRGGPTDTELEARLFALAGELAWPETPQLNVAEPKASRPLPLRRRQILVAAAIVLLALGTALAISGGFRDSVAGLFGVDGLSIELRRNPESGEGINPATNLSIGTEISLDEATNQLPFGPLVPETLGSPDAVFLRTLPGNDQMLSLVYLPSDRVPETAETGVGLLLMQFASTFDSAQLVKTLITDFSQVQIVYFDGHEAYWIEGLSELTILSDPSTGVSEESTRPTANVLIWQDDDVTYRLESALARDEALAIAESLRPAEG